MRSKLVVLYYLTVLLACCLAENTTLHYCVRPTTESHETCPDPCHTLSLNEYATYSEAFFTNTLQGRDVVLQFMPGDHIFDAPLVVYGLNSFRMVGNAQDSISYWKEIL